MFEIYDDLYGIVKKIKQINSNYRVFRNVLKHKFEIYYQNGINLDLELVVPYSRLDYRTINFLNQTKVENADKIFKEIESHNLKCGFLGVVWN